MQKLRSLLPLNAQNATTTNRHSVCLEPEIGFQISIEAAQPPSSRTGSNTDCSVTAYQQRASPVPELNVHLIGAHHLPTLFGFKIVHGYMIKVKLFPGTKRLDSSIQTNSWPKFNENFKFPLVPDIKPSLKHAAARRGSKVTTNDFRPEDLLAGQFVVFTVYVLLELPPASFSRFGKTYRSLRDKSSNLMQKVYETSSGRDKDKMEKDKHDMENKQNGESSVKMRNARDSMPPLTISESRRNIGCVTCYLEPKLFKRNPRSGLFTTDEIWLPIKDINKTIVKSDIGAATNNNNNNNNQLENSAKGLVEIILEVRDLNHNLEADLSSQEAKVKRKSSTNCSTELQTMRNSCSSSSSTTTTTTTPTPINGSTLTHNSLGIKNPKWNRMTAEVKRKISNTTGLNKPSIVHNLSLAITTARMRCSTKVKDELEGTAGTVYVKTTAYEHGIYVDSWKSSTFYPSLSTKWNIGSDTATFTIPLQAVDNLENVLIKTTLATKTKMGKKLVLGTVYIGLAAPPGLGVEHLRHLRDANVNERIPMWHEFQ